VHFILNEAITTGNLFTICCHNEIKCRLAYVAKKELVMRQEASQAVRKPKNDCGLNII